MKKVTLYGTLLTLISATALPSIAIVHDFDTPPALGPTQGPGVWYTDRYNPAVFEQEFFDGDNRLHIGIDGSDQQDNSFYNYQGRKYDFGDSVFDYCLTADLYVDSSWNANNTVNVGIWGTTLDSEDNVAGYPIIAWRESSTVDSGFYAFDYFNGGWIEVGTSYSAGDWYNIQMAYTGASMDYYINGSLALSFLDSSQDGTWGNIILNTYNTGEDIDVRWDNVGTVMKSTQVPDGGTAFALFSFAALALEWSRRRSSSR